MKPCVVCLLVVNLVLNPYLLVAQEGEVPPRRSDSSVMATFHWDIKALPVNGLLRRIEEAYPDIAQAKSFAVVKTLSNPLDQALTEGGARQVVGTFSPRWVTSGNGTMSPGISFSVSCRDSSKFLPLLKRLLDQAPIPFRITEAQDRVVLTSGSQLPNTTSPWPLLTSATQSAALVVRIPTELRAEIANIWPDRLPNSIPLKISPRQVMRDVASLSVELTKADPEALHAVIDCVNEVAAERMREVVNTNSMRLDPAIVASWTLTREDSSVHIRLPLSSLTASSAAVTMSLHQLRSVHHLKQLLLGLHQFHEVHGMIIPRENRSAQGTSLLSWRVLLLPYLGQQKLYERFHLDESWDSDHNRPLIQEMPTIFAGEGLAVGHTRFQLPLLPDGPWSGDGPPLTFRSLRDGTSNTIGIIEAPSNRAVIWTKPNELPMKKDNVIATLFGEGASAVIGRFDGSVTVLPRNIGSEKLLALLTHQGGEQ